MKSFITLINLLLAVVFPAASSTPQARISPTPPPALTLETVLDNDVSWITDPSVVRLTVTGDILAARTINAKVRETQDFGYPFKSMLPVLTQPDITFVNLETPLTPDCQTSLQGTVFCGDTRFAQELVKAGVDVVTFANNHAYDQGVAGHQSTQDLLSRAGLKVVDNSRYEIIPVKGTRFAFVGFNEICCPKQNYPLTENHVQTVISQVRPLADVVVVQFHWGTEYTHIPTSRQIQFAHKSIDWGADLVVGNHPHWTQPAELYKGKLIMYSHGNFVFDQNWSQKTREGLVGEYYFIGNKLVDTRFIPVLISTSGEPQSPPQAKPILDNFLSLTRQGITSR